MFYGRAVLLVAQVVSRRSGSEQVDRVDKLIDYADAGVDHYWIIDLEPRPIVQLHVLESAAYWLDATVHASHRVEVDKPFGISFDPAKLLDPYRSL